MMSHNFKSNFSSWQTKNLQNNLIQPLWSINHFWLVFVATLPSEGSKQIDGIKRVRPKSVDICYSPVVDIVPGKAHRDPLLSYVDGGP